MFVDQNNQLPNAVAKSHWFQYACNPIVSALHLFKGAFEMGKKHCDSTICVYFILK